MQFGSSGERGRKEGRKGAESKETFSSRMKEWRVMKAERERERERERKRGKYIIERGIYSRELVERDFVVCC